MSISSRIWDIDSHLLDDYSVLELAGSDLTNVNKNVVNLKPTWRERLLYFMNNGTDIVWNNWNKVTGSGTTLSINGTVQAPMSLVYKGQTSQTGTPTPESPQDIHVVSGDNYINVVGKNLLKLSNTSGTKNGVTYTWEGNKLTLNGTTTSATDIYNFGWWGATTESQERYLKAGNYNLSIQGSSNIGRFSANGYYGGTLVMTLFRDSNNNTREVPNDTYYSNFYISILSNITFNNETFYFQLERSSTKSDYEQYQKESYEINLGKNLLNNTLTTQTLNGVTATRNNDGSVTLNGTATAQTDFTFLNTKLELEDGTYTFSISDVGNSNVRLQYGVTGYGIMDTGTATTSYTTTFPNSSIGTSYSYINMYRVRVVNGAVLNNYTIYPMIEKGSQATSYSPYFTPIELCKIGDYQDRFIKTSGKNLFDKSTITSGYRLDGSGIPNGSASNEFTSDFIEVESGETYIRNYGSVSAYTRTCFYDENKSFVSKNDDSQSFTIPGNVKYIRFSEYLSRLDTMQLEKGSQVTSYEPYGSNEWYVKKEIGKVVLDGVNFKCNYVYNTPSSSFNVYDTANSKDVRGAKYNEWEGEGLILCDRLKGLSARQLNSNVGVTIYNQGEIRARLSTTETLTVAQVNEILQTNNYTIYYVLATPIYTEITDTTLLGQLEAIKKSYHNQTNISQENNDLPFELDVVALGVM